jgi:hypothetical protein|tara:strand:- start:1832 stop:2077 length:246 start_codon:yes stop_codon:yes gene_type:complete
MIPRDSPMLGLASSTMAIFAPKKSVIVDMVMVQLLSVIVTLGIIMLTGSGDLSSDTMAYLVAGLFGAFFMLGNIYSRISNV